MMKTIYLAMMVLLVSVTGFSDEPTTIKRVRGRAGVAERVESAGKAAKENTVRVRVARIIDGVVVQERVVVKGSDVFASKPKPERKEQSKERPQPASVKVKVKK